MDADEYLERAQQTIAAGIMASRLPPAHGLYLEIKGERLARAITERVAAERAAWAKLASEGLCGDCACVPGDAAKAPDPYAASHTELAFVVEHLVADRTYVLSRHEARELVTPMLPPGGTGWGVRPVLGVP